MAILNYTNRHLTFVHPENLTPLKSGKFLIPDGEELIKLITVYKQSYPLECRVRIVDRGIIDGVPTIEEVVTGIDALPEVGPDDILIVTRQYAEACQHFCMSTVNMRVVTGAVYEKGNSHPVACTSLAKVKPCLYDDMPQVFSIENPNIITQNRIDSL